MPWDYWIVFSFLFSSRSPPNLWTYQLFHMNKPQIPECHISSALEVWVLHISYLLKCAMPSYFMFDLVSWYRCIVHYLEESFFFCSWSAQTVLYDFAINCRFCFNIFWAQRISQQLGCQPQYKPRQISILSSCIFRKSTHFVLKTSYTFPKLSDGTFN